MRQEETVISFVFFALPGLIDKEEAGAFEAEMSSLGRVNRVLVDIMRHFRPTLIIDTLRSICRRIISLASDATGSLLLKVTEPNKLLCHHPESSLVYYVAWKVGSLCPKLRPACLRLQRNNPQPLSNRSLGVIAVFIICPCVR